MKIGIYGGTFNPPHIGHVEAAQAAMEELALDRLLVIPDGTPPHKEIPDGSPTAQDRGEMALLAFGPLGKKVEVLDWELKRTGKSYTSDTLRQVKELYPNDEIWLLMGTDMFLTLHQWHEPEVICKLAGLAPFRRDDFADFGEQSAFLQSAYGVRIHVVDNTNCIELSSTQVREKIAAGSAASLLPEAVWGYIRRKGLYGADCSLKGLSPEALRPIALSYLKPKRMPHVLGTEQEAIRLARRYGADEEKARIAALLHDCTKKLEMDEQLALCRQYGLKLDKLEKKALKLLHSRTGAEVARDVFGADDEIWSAIRWHTTGKADMTTLEKVIYLADYIEPTREFPGVDSLRKTVYEDLDRGMLLGLQMTIREMKEMGNPIHHNTVEARDDLLRKGVSL